MKLRWRHFGLVLLICTMPCILIPKPLNAKITKTSGKPKICLILDKAGKDDNSFNAQAYAGFMKAKKQLAIASDSKFVTPVQDAQIPQMIREFSRGDCALVIATGFTISEQVGLLAKQYPGQLFLALDAPINDMNVKSVTFKDHEGAFLVGYIAALKSATGKLGFIGGMEIPLVKRFALAYQAGAKYQNSQTTFRTSFISTNTSGWTNISRAKEMALAQYNQNVDVILAVAGGASRGVFDAAKEKNAKEALPRRFAIGVDANQNALAPGIILTNIEKRLDLAVYDSINELLQGRFSTGIYDLGLTQGAVSWSYDAYNKNLFSTQEIEKIKNIEKLIMSGKIDVPDFYKNPRSLL